MSKLDISYNNYKDYINIDKYKIKNLPEGVSISTMCATGNLGTEINAKNVEDYLSLDINSILSIKKDANNQRTLIHKKKRKTRNLPNDVILDNQPKTVKFQNQITVVMRLTEGPTESLIDEPKINIKLLKMEVYKCLVVRQLME